MCVILHTEEEERASRRPCLIKFTTNKYNWVHRLLFLWSILAWIKSKDFILFFKKNRILWWTWKKWLTFRWTQTINPPQLKLSGRTELNIFPLWILKWYTCNHQSCLVSPVPPAAVRITQWERSLMASCENHPPLRAKRLSPLQESQDMERSAADWLGLNRESVEGRKKKIGNLRWDDLVRKKKNTFKEVRLMKNEK